MFTKFQCNTSLCPMFDAGCRILVGWCKLHFIIIKKKKTNVRYKTTINFHWVSCKHKCININVNQKWIGNVYRKSSFIRGSMRATAIRKLKPSNYYELFNFNYCHVDEERELCVFHQSVLFWVDWIFPVLFLSFLFFLLADLGEKQYPKCCR